MSRKVTTNQTASDRSQKSLPYVPCRHLLTPGERRFYRDGLQPAVGDRWLIAFKPRLADIITTENFQSRHGRRIAMKHLDFVLMTPKTTRIVAAIELNDTSHTAEDRAGRDAFVADALRVAGVPLIGFPIYRKYAPDRIRSHILRQIAHCKARSAGQTVPV